MTDHKLDSSLTYDKYNKLISSNDDEYFLNESTIDELLTDTNKVKRMFRDDLLESISLEWSIASNCLSSDDGNKPVGNPYLVFYEARTI